MSDLLLIQNALRDALRPKRLATTFLLIILPAALGLAFRLLTPADEFVGADLYDTLTAFLIFTFLLPILAVIYGTGVVAQEIEGRTIVYLLTRPHPRWRILLAKTLVCVFVVFVTVALSILVLTSVLYDSSFKGELAQDLPAAFIGSLCYSAVFILLGAAVPNPLVYGLMFVFAWETWVPRLPGQYVRMSIMTYLRVLSGRELTGESTDTGGNLLLTFAAPPKIDIPAREGE
jgi:ABC-2 type transport system permease protein